MHPIVPLLLDLRDDVKEIWGLGRKNANSQVGCG